jgi:translation initiation factor 3 subunit L
MLGYYSMIGLLRVHTLLGDYYTALKSIDCIDFTKRVQLFSKVVACHITLYYYTGFVFMMMRRYSDAIKFFTQLLTYINRIKNIHAKSYQYDDTTKKNEQIYYLLAMTLSLCPQRHGIDEVVVTSLRDRLGDKMARLAQGEIEAYSEMFKYACPKFISMSTSFSSDTSTPTSVMEALELQRNVFLNEVKQQVVLPTIRSYLSLYSTITVGKLATFMETDNHNIPENMFRMYLLRLKHKTRQLVWTGGRPSEGERLSVSDIAFYIDKDMVYVQNSVNVASQQQRSHAQYFIDQIRYLKPCLETLFAKQR